MHLGNVYCALLSWLSARSQGGEWLLRIEDLDAGRCREEFVLQLMDDLRWLGLDWDEGPYFQSQRGSVYEDFFARLDTYPCFCSRADLMSASAPHASDGRRVYNGTCRNLDVQRRMEQTAMRRPAWRVRVPDKDIVFYDLHYGEQKINLAQEWGDFVVKRSDDSFAYQLAVTVDDALMGVTEVVRGVDLLSSVAPQMYLYEALGLQTPSFCHVPLLCNEAGQRLCKRDKSLDMGELRQHYSPQQIVGMLAYHAGLIPKPEAIETAELVTLFRWSQVPLDNVVVTV